MTINLDEYQELLDKIDPHVRDTLQPSFNEAAHVMSPAGLRKYMDGALALSGLGRGNDLVVSYLQEMPAVIKETGEDVLDDCISESLKLASMVSGEVIALLFASLPSAARRLGDAELLRGYLKLIRQLSAKAPRGLRPMLSRLDELFSKLTLGGLRRWALWGAQAHARDFPAQLKYFALESSDSLAVLQQERRGTLFVDQHRRLNFYLRAFWGRDFFLRPTSGDYETREGYKPFIENRFIHLPDAFDAYAGLPGGELYRVAAAHAAAHLVYTTAPISAEQLTPVQMAFIGIFEDARIEYLAISEFPGMQQLWNKFHVAVSEVSCPVDPIVGLLERTAHALLDAAYQDEDPRIMAIASEFHERVRQTPQDNQLSWDLGVTFYNVLREDTAIPSARTLEGIAIPYRDDNRFIWAFADNVWADDFESLPGSQRQVRKHMSVMEMVNELDCELAGDDAQEIWVMGDEFFRDGDPAGMSINQVLGKEPVSDPYHYHEWDYHIQLHRPDWATVLEKRQPKGEAEAIDRVLDDYKPIAGRIKQIIDALQPEGVIRQRRQEEGDEIDLEAAIRALVDLRLGHTPDTRINMRHIRKTRDLAVLVLLDLSESTNEVLPGSDRPVLQLAREATALLSWAINGIGDPFAIHGFASDGRHDVQYYRFKDFDQPYDDEVKSKLAGMQGGLSTRMGAALRHGAHYLQQRPERKKLLLLVSDGEPADIDERDPQYLRQDTKKAVEELATRGVTTYCLTLDANADDYVQRIFGTRGYTVVDHVQRLPEKLPAVFMALTR